MPETPEQLWERAHAALRTPPVEEWETWPFVGTVEPRLLDRPVDVEPRRHGADGIECRRCTLGDEDALWGNDNWFVSANGPNGLPMVVALFTRQHVDFPDLPPQLQAELGTLLVRIERAVASIPGVGNVHVCRWGDGSEHCHVWIMARPARMPQLIGSFAAIWDDVLPPVPDDVWRANCELVRAALN